MQSCVKSGPDIVDKVQSDMGSLRHILRADIIAPRTHQRLRLLLDEDLPELIREARELRGYIGQRYVEEVDYEYGIEMQVSGIDSRTGEGRIYSYIVGRHFPQNVGSDMWYFGDQTERQVYKEFLEMEMPDSKFWMVKRRKAGKVERV